MLEEKNLIGAIDVGGTKVAVGLVTSVGQIVSRRSLRTDRLPSCTIALDAIETSLRECLQEAGATLSCIGIGCTGPVDPISGVVGNVANLPGWQGCSLVKELSNRFSIPVAMENDADAAALAEATWGSGVGVSRFLYITISTGIGAGFLLDGEVYRGVDGSHPEMGHHSIDPSGPECYCGANGCWESLASGSAIKTWYLDHDQGQRFTPDSFSAETIFDLYREGDPMAKEAIERLSYYIGLGLANLTTILVPGRITIGGGIALSADTFLAKTVEAFRNICREVPSDKTEITVANAQNDVGLTGAAAIWVQRKCQAIRKV